MMFKLMFLKKLNDLSAERLISQANTDMAVKYFLDLDPEDPMVDPSLMTKFRKTRITKDMLKETIRQAIEKGLIKFTAIIVDDSRYQQLSLLGEKWVMKPAAMYNENEEHFAVFLVNYHLFLLIRQDSCN